MKVNFEGLKSYSGKINSLIKPLLSQLSAESTLVYIRSLRLFNNVTTILLISFISALRGDNITDELSPP